MSHPTRTYKQDATWLESARIDPSADNYFYLFVDEHDQTHGVGKYSNKFGDVTGMWYMNGSNKVRLDMNRLETVMPATHGTENKPGFRYVSYPEFMLHIEVDATVDGSRVQFTTKMGRRVSEGQVRNRAISRISHELNQHMSIPLLTKYFKDHPDQLSIRRL